MTRWIATTALCCVGLTACDISDRGAGAPSGELMTNAVVPDAREDKAQVANADGWIGDWKGVEGLHLTIAKRDGPGRYRLTMQYSLDDKGVFDGTATADGIAFARPDGAQVLRASDGDATGLKWLAGKTDCLTVKAGEGYCRD